MKILHVMPYSPVPPHFGGALRTYHLLNQLSQRHQVTVVSYGTVDDLGPLVREFGDRLEGIHLVRRPWTSRFRRLGQLRALATHHSYFYLHVHTKEMQRVIAWLLRTQSFDFVQTEFALTGMFDYHTSAVKILDAHNVEYDNFRRMWLNARSIIRRFHYHREYRKFFHEEINACKKHDALFVTSDRDKEILDKDVPAVPKFVIPNGVDTSYFIPGTVPREPWSLVFTGMMAYVPNYDGMLYFLDEIFPRILRQIPEAKITIVGSKPPAELRRRASSKVRITGYVDDVRPYVWGSSVYVVPLRMGGGTRLKVLEAMSMKIPIVTTSIGSEGIDIRHGESVLVADEPEAFAQAVVQLLLNQHLRDRLVTNGFDLVKTYYDWSIIGERIESLLLEFHKSRRHSTVTLRPQLRDASLTTQVGG